jgi:pSer/pThr/pTyr-binding forkhead associated (FHA) protein
MAKLILTLDGEFIREVELDKERMTIGRKPHNDIQIENLAVSGEHAAVTTLLNDSFLEDLDSTNGTLVNGQPVKRHVLRHGDEIEIGRYVLKYVNPHASEEAPDFEKTMILRTPSVRKPDEPGEATSRFVKPMATPQPAPGRAPHMEKKAPPPPQSPAAALPAAALQVLNGANAGKELELTKSLTSLGKPGVQVAVIARRPHGYFITHVQGSSFPMVNGVTLNAHPHPLNDHDIIELAGVKMEFFFK